MPLTKLSIVLSHVGLTPQMGLQSHHHGGQMWSPFSQLPIPHLEALALICPIRHPYMGPWIVAQRTYYESNFTIKCPSIALLINLRYQLGPAHLLLYLFYLMLEDITFKEVTSRVNATPLPFMITHGNAQT